MTHKGPIGKNALVNLYINQKLSMREVGERLDRCGANILYWLREHDIETRVPNSPGDYQLYKRDELFFDAWSPEMAWVLGLMFADGNVKQASQNGWSCTLYSVDVRLLQQVAELIQTGATPRRGTGSAYTLLVGSTLIGRSLVALGCIPAKSRTMQFPVVPPAYLSHFVRGLWDGDGCIFVRERQRSRTRHGTPNTHRYREVTTEYVSGSKCFVAALRDHIREQVEIPTRVRKRQAQYKPFYTISYYHRNSLRLLSWMYQDSAPQTRLDRKYNLAKEFL